jgi:urea transport system permease protein
MPDAWLFALGGLFVFVTLFLPKGILGTAQERWGAWRERAWKPPLGNGAGVPHPAE